MRRIEDIYEQSLTQQAIIFDCLLSGDPACYVEQICATIVGPLDVAAFIGGWRRVVARHPALRTEFDWRAKSPVQIVIVDPELEIWECDLSENTEADGRAEIERFLAADRARGFDLGVAPLMRLAIFRCGDQTTRMIWTIHHLILDAWSIDIVLREVLAFYLEPERAHADLGSSGPPFRGYIRWLRTQNFSAAETFWRSELIKGGPSTVVADSIIGPRSEKSLHERLTWPPTLMKDLNEAGRILRVPITTLMVGALALILGRYTKRRQIWLGILCAGRPATLPAMESTVGVCINTIPFYVSVAGDAKLVDWLANLCARLTEAMDHQYLGLANILRLSGAEHRLFDSVIVVQNVGWDLDRRGLTGLRFDDVHTRGHSSVPVTVRMTPGTGLTAELVAGPRQLPAGHARSLLDDLRAALESLISAVLTNDSARLRDLQQPRATAATTLKSIVPPIRPVRS